jgi:hypothetical protein
MKGIAMPRIAYIVLTASLVAASHASAFASDNANNWHIHDGQDLPGHKPIGFFDDILGETLNGQPTDEYLEDPATCPDATDKDFLPNGRQEGQPVRSGMCQTSEWVIHLRTIPSDSPAPEGYQVAQSGGGYTTYYKLTERSR